MAYLTLIEQIELLAANRGKYRKVFPGYVTHIRFPRYKIIADGTRIDFAFPLGSAGWVERFEEDARPERFVRRSGEELDGRIRVQHEGRPDRRTRRRPVPRSGRRWSRNPSDRRRAAKIGSGLRPPPISAAQLNRLHLSTVAQ